MSPAPTTTLTAQRHPDARANRVSLPYEMELAFQAGTILHRFALRRCRPGTSLDCSTPTCRTACRLSPLSAGLATRRDSPLTNQSGEQQKPLLPQVVRPFGLSDCLRCDPRYRTLIRTRKGFRPSSVSDCRPICRGRKKTRLRASSYFKATALRLIHRKDWPAVVLPTDSGKSESSEGFACRQRGAGNYRMGHDCPYGRSKSQRQPYCKRLRRSFQPVEAPLPRLNLTTPVNRLPASPGRLCLPVGPHCSSVGLDTLRCSANVRWKSLAFLQRLRNSRRYSTVLSD